MKQYEKITLEEDIIIPKGTEMVGKMMTLEKDTTIEKGDSILMHPSGFVTVISRTKVKGKAGAFDIQQKQFGEAIWKIAKAAKHKYESVNEALGATDNKEENNEPKIISEPKIIPISTKDKPN